jgi:hypothetical protein
MAKHKGEQASSNNYLEDILTWLMSREVKSSSEVIRDEVWKGLNEFE